MSDKDRTNIEPRLDLTDQEGKTLRKPKDKESFIDFLKELPVLIVIAFIIALILRTFVFQTTLINQESMEPALYPNDRTIVTKFAYWFSDPKPGDVIILVPPQINDGRDFVKRVVAIGGNLVQIKNGKLYVNGRPSKGDYKTMPGDHSSFGPYRIPKNDVFVLGDNRPVSQDSRWFGPVPKKNIVGKVVLTFWPIDHLKLFI